MAITLGVDDAAITEAIADLAAIDDYYVELPVPDVDVEALTSYHQERLLSGMYSLTTEYDVFTVDGMPAGITNLSLEVAIRDYADEEGDRMITLAVFVDWTDSAGRDQSVQARIFDFGLTIELFRSAHTIAEQVTAYAHHVADSLNTRLVADHDGWVAITAA